MVTVGFWSFPLFNPTRDTGRALYQPAAWVRGSRVVWNGDTSEDPSVQPALSCPLQTSSEWDMKAARQGHWGRQRTLRGSEGLSVYTKPGTWPPKLRKGVQYLVPMAPSQEASSEKDSQKRREVK